MRRNVRQKLCSILLTVILTAAVFVPSGYAYENNVSAETEISTEMSTTEINETVTENITDNIPVEVPSVGTTEISENDTATGNNVSVTKNEKKTAENSSSMIVSDKVVEIGVGEKYRCIPENYAKDKVYMWSVSNPDIAEVDENGYVTARKTGTVRVMSRCGNDTYICKVKIGTPPTSVLLNASYLKMGVGEEYRFQAQLNRDATAYKKYFCSSSSLGMPVNASTGLAKAIKPGRYSVAFFTYNNVYAKCSVVVQEEPKSVSFPKTSVNIVPGKSYTVNPVFSAGSYSSQLKVSSSNENVVSAYISADNKVVMNAIKTGTSVVTLTTHNGKTAQCTVTVKEQVVSLSATAISTSILRGNHTYIKTEVSPSDVSVTFSSSNSDVASVDEYGIVTGKGSGTAIISAKAGSIVRTFSISVSAYSSDTYLPYSRYTLNNGKTLYLKSLGSSFSSSDTSVASVTQKGFVTAHKRGVAIITADYYGDKKTCALIVDGALPVRFSYSSPNFASKNEKVTLIAVTDMQRTAVRFQVNDKGKINTVQATEKSVDSSGQHYIWKGYYTFSSAGEYPVSAYSMYKDSGTYATGSGGKSTVMVADVTSATEVSKLRRRGSEAMLRMNSTFEGYSDHVYDDPLVYDTPTVGYGHVVYAGEEFYNDMSKEEAFAFMVDDINNSVYTSAVNNFMERNNIKFNQQQFDALIMFSYNLGPGYVSSGAVSEALLDCWHNGERNLNYVNKSVLQRRWVQLHHAGGVCIWGLLYRRIDEVEMFCYGDYVLDGRNNKYGIPYNWNCNG